MPRLSKSAKVSKGEEDSVFQMIVGVTVVALLAGINMFFFEPSSGSAVKVTADVANSVAAVDTSAPKVADFPPLPEDQAQAPEADASDPKPQCDFRSNVKNIIYGQPVKFYWDCVKADTCALDSVGNVPVSKKDGVEIVPKRSAKYQLICGNANGNRSFDIDIGVFEFSLREVNLNK